MNTKITRRQLFRLRLSDLSDLVFEKEEEKREQAQMEIFRPPGALKKEADFLALCEGCPLCSKACPYDSIHHLGPAAGALEGTPALEPNIYACRWCPDMPCIHSCPTGALALDSENKIAPMGKAVLNLETCLTTEGIICDRCAVTCPPDIKAIIMHNRKPVLDEEKCVGCGLCVLYCESTPVSIKIVPALEH